MKKTLIVSILMSIILFVGASVVSAATTETLADELYVKGKKYGMTTADKVRIERYLSENPVTDEQANQIMSKADEAVAVMENAGVTNYNKLTQDKKSELKTIAKETADIVGAKLVFKSGSVEIYDANGKLIETVAQNNGKLAYTGNNSVNVVLTVSVIAMIALAITVGGKKLQTQNKLTQSVKATISSIIVALLITGLLLFGVKLFLGREIETIFTLANKVSISTNSNKNTEQPTIVKKEEKYTLKNYPEYGTQYATIEIDKIDVNLPVYFGDTLDVLKKGVGHSTGSYFPGEGGSIVYMGHNSKKVFRRFSELQIGDEIKITTSYGEYTYKIYDMELINETDVDKLPIQRDKEILMIYTCYPFNNIGYATQRYVVYAELEK